MIKSKKCKLCNNNSFSKGLCQMHQPKKGIKQSRATTKIKTEEKQEKRSVYFEYHLEQCTKSDESYKEISNPTRANICHIFDKARHPSLQDNLENCIYLTLNEHQDFDRLLYTHQFTRLEEDFKNSFNKACIIGNNLIYLCEESTVFSREFKKYLDGREIKS